MSSLKIILILIFLAHYSQETTQQTTIDNSQTIEATCEYIYDSQSTYTCNLLDAVILNEFDDLEITGTHLTNNSDYDVLIVNYYNTTSKYFKGEVFKKFQNLQTLKLMGQNLEIISQNAFEVCSNLIFLNIEYNYVTALPRQMLSNCGKLIVLRITHTGLSDIPEDLLGVKTYLTNLIISNNQLTSLPENLLKDVKFLHYFDASNNFLTELSWNFFANSPNLMHVDLSYNNFEDQANITALNNQLNLLHLVLSFNNFSNFNFNFFSQFVNLQKLTIGSTEGPKFTQISWQSLPSSLRILIVYGVGEDIPENAFDHLVGLYSLSLTGRDIQSLHKDTFKALTKLELISIQETNISSLHPELFINQRALTDLNLRDNKIESLPVGIFTSLSKLGLANEHHGIKMSFNNIQRLNSNSFGQHPFLRYIDFSSNKINEIENEIFDKFHSNLTYVDFILNSCVNDMFVHPTTLDLSLAPCYVNWIGTTTTQSTTVGTTKESTTSEQTTAEPTTPGGSERHFRLFEVVLVNIVAGMLIVMQM